MKRRIVMLGLLAGAVLLAGCGSTENSGAAGGGHSAGKLKEVEGLTIENYTAGENQEKGSYYVCLPEGYDESLHYPVIYLMPYDGYSPAAYVEDGIVGTYDDILASEAAEDMILVMPQFSEKQDYDQMLPGLVADVDEKYSTIAETDYRGILGVNVGAYMAYEAVLNNDDDLFYAAGAHMGDFTSEANPYLEKANVAELVNALDQKGSSKGYDYLSEHYFYLDAPNGEATTTDPDSSTDIGSGLQKRSNPYYQWGYSMYAVPDGKLVSYAVLDGVADSAYYLGNLERSLGAFSDRFSEHMYQAEMSVAARAVAEERATIDGSVKVSFAQAAGKHGESLAPAILKVTLLDETRETVLSEQSFELAAMQDTTQEFSFDKKELAQADTGYIQSEISFLGKTLPVDEQSVVLLKDYKVGDANPCVDLRGDWYFNAYKMYGAPAKMDLDTVAGVKQDEFEKWDVVQPGFGWWTTDFAASLKGQENFAGYAWYVRNFTLDEAFPKDQLQLAVGYFDEANEVYVNGKLIGSTGMNYVDGVGVYDETNPWDVNCVYDIDSSVLNYGGENTIAIRMCNSDGGGGWYDGPIGLYTKDSYAALASGGSERIKEESYESAALRGDTETYRIYLPEGYDESKTYPVMYLLHGINSTSKAFVIDGIDRLLDQAIADGTIEPMIVVMPDDPTKTSFWTGAYARMVADDLLADVESKYSVATDREHRFIAGCSMGGAGSMNIGLNNPDKFGGIVSFYGAFSYVNAIQTAQKMSPEELKTIKFYMACGNQDMYDFYVDQEYMSRLLTMDGVEHYHYIDNGTHSSTFYLPTFIPAIQYMMQ